MPTHKLDQSARILVNQLTTLTDQLHDITVPESARTRNELRKSLLEQIARLADTAERLDPVLRPLSLFDPGDPQTSARMISLTAVSQPRHPLGAIKPFYGAGVYLLYYNGDFAPYATLSGKEQPIYVGKADPGDRHATNAVEQGQALHKRLNEHARSIRAATTTLDIADFDCRFLVIQSGFQQAAESRLINYFKPIWNNESDICFGIGKHGDSATTRANKRSPWDTLHPGRSWARAIVSDQKPLQQILYEISAHLEKYPPKATVGEIIEAFTDELRQLKPSHFEDVTGQPEDVEDPSDSQLSLTDYSDEPDTLT
ncbi:Eco29kI family restriction endonuclease [Amycolatopsis nivea]